MTFKLLKVAGVTAASLFLGLFSIVPLSQGQVQCGLGGVRTNSSEASPIILPSIPENITAGEFIWTTNYFGNPAWADLDPGSDMGYLGGMYLSDGSFVITSTESTSKFVQNENRTFIKSYNRLYCNPENITTYYFHVPVDV